jgi:hypothetical protein
MATSGTYTFNLDAVDIVEEAFERCSLELRTANDMETARRSLDLLLLEWANDQVNIWTLEYATLAMVATTTSYSLPSETVDVLDAVVRETSGSTNNDVPSERISIEEYLNRTDKDAAGRSVQHAIHRGRDALTLYVYPAPDKAYTFLYWKMRYVEDVGALSNNVDIPRRFLPALIAGLAYKIGEKNQAKQLLDDVTGRMKYVDGVQPQQLALLKGNYLETYQKAREEDRDRASLIATPKLRRL